MQTDAVTLQAADTAPAPAAPGLPPHVQVIQMATAYWISRAIYVVAELGIADVLKDGAKPVDEIAAATGAHASALRRVLRTLASVGLFSTDSQGRVSLTTLGASLQSDAPGAARSTVLFAAGDWWWSAWGEVLHSVRTGETGLEKVFGVDEYEFLEQHPEEATHFNVAMTGFHGEEPAAIVDAYDFSGTQRIVDVGGGAGNLLGTILAANPTVRGTLFERPQVVPDAERNLAAAGVGDRCEIVGGDFLESVPAGGDLYIVSHCIHNWDEGNCIRILENCRRAMAPGGRLLIVEAVVSAGDVPDGAKMLDLAMLLVPGGEERSEDEYRALLTKAGFRLTRVVPTRTSASLIEAVPA